MYDQPLFLRTLSGFARALPAAYDVENVLSDLAESVTAVLNLAGAGVSLSEGGRLQFFSAVNEASGTLERVQQQYQLGPCRDAYETGLPVCVRDVSERADEWPDYVSAAAQAGIAGVAGVPMRLADEVIGALNLYASGPRDWSDEDIAVAGVLADMATGLLVNASKRQQQQQLNDQLQQALESRIVIEQAKGITAGHSGVSVDGAFQAIRGHARQHSTSLRSVAEAIVKVGLRV
ncbi:MAG TPA: GAF and ANTAR domain-containing protein [Frankiaceae bacterium]|nr:GAF and ANTAR domain-containing protein [Frankiaceae bacterium]